MRKNLLLLVILTTALAFLFSHCNKEENEKYHFDFDFVTENYEPLNYTENGIVTGLAPELLEEICARLNIPYEVTVKLWSEAYAYAQSNSNTVLFSTILNAERKDLFKWAGPFAALEWNFYSQAQNPVILQTLNEAKSVGSIGVLEDYSIEQYLVNEGFTNLVYCTDHADAFDKLLNGEIDLYPSDRITAEAALTSLGHSVYTIAEKLPIRTEMIYFAFNRQIPDDVVADIQREIDALKENGYLKTLYQTYLKSANFPGTLQIYTEEYPPLTFMNSFGEIGGFGTDLVNEIMKRNQLYNNIKLTTWSNAYEIALHHPNICLFTMDKTEIREDLFEWVGPIGTNSTYFYIKAGSGIVINNLQDAMSLSSVGTVSSWFSDQHLRDLGFTNLVSGDNPGSMTQQLMAGVIDAFVCSSVTFPDILLAQGFSYEDVDAEYTLMSSDYYIAFSKNTSESIINQWASAFEKMQTDGTYDAIYNKWFPE